MAKVLSILLPYKYARNPSINRPMFKILSKEPQMFHKAIVQVGINRWVKSSIQVSLLRIYKNRVKVKSSHRSRTDHKVNKLKAETASLKASSTLVTMLSNKILSSIPKQRKKSNSKNKRKRKCKNKKFSRSLMSSKTTDNKIHKTYL